MSKRLIEEDWGLYLKDVSKKARTDKEESLEKERLERRAKEECIVASRPFTPEMLQKIILDDLKTSLENAALKGFPFGKFCVQKNQVVHEYTCTLFSWERVGICKWILTQVADVKGLVIRMDGSYSIHFSW